MWYFAWEGGWFVFKPNDMPKRLMDNIARAMAGVPKEILRRQVVQLYRADPAYGAGVSRRAGVEVVPERAA